jgi:hypothetical protein
MVWDLAANLENRIHPDFYGPGSPHNEDALAVEEWPRHGLLWLNPPFNNIRKFAAKCNEQSANGAEICMLVPASVSTNWFADYVEGNAFVLPIRPRLKFVNWESVFPKDLMLVLWGVNQPCVTDSEPLIQGPMFQTWKWR